MNAQNSVVARIARPYASALFDLAVEAGEVEVVELALDGVAQLVETSPDFARFLRSPVISGEEKQAAMAGLVKKGLASGLTANFLSLVARNRRLFALGRIISDFKDMAAKARGETRAEVVSATPLSGKQTQALIAELKRKLGQTVALETSVDPSLIGGLVVKVGSQMIDSSLKTKLTAMRIAMKEVR